MNKHKLTKKIVAEGEGRVCECDAKQHEFCCSTRGAKVKGRVEVMHPPIKIDM